MLQVLAALQPLYVSTGTVALAEIGDKTQLLALLRAARVAAALVFLALGLWVAWRGIG